MRKQPDRVYKITPDEEAARLVSVTLRPFHFWVLSQLRLDSKGVSPKLQLLVDEAAQNAGITREAWEALSIEEKAPFVKGQKGAGQKHLEKRKKQRRGEE